MQIKNVESILEEYQVLKSLFKANKKKEIWLNDAGRSMPHEFSCDQCKKSKIQITIITDPEINFASTRTVTFGMNTEELISKGGLGNFFQCVKCENCMAIYYVGIGCIEPNYGRDVFVLHVIWRLGLRDQ